MTENQEEHYTPSASGKWQDELRLSFVDFGADVAFRWNRFFSDFQGNMKKAWEHIKSSDKWQLCGMLTLVAFLSFADILVNCGFTIPVNGDFRLQGMTFIYNGYDDWHYYFRTGVFPLWNTRGALGMDNIAGYSFYYLFDPFFLALLIWPRAWLNQMQAIFMMVKLIMAGMFFYDYLGSFHITRGSRKIAAVCYAFCGWGWYYLWFFHMPEAMTFLPLMLWGIEKIIRKRDPRLLTVGMFLMGTTNYQFLAFFSVLCFFYAMFRFFQTLKERDASGNWEVLGIGFVAFVIGIVLSCFIIFPSYLLIQDMPRMSQSSTMLNQLKNAKSFSAVFKLLFYWDSSFKYRSLYPLETLLFMPNTCFEAPLMKLNGGRYDNAASSLYITSPAVLLIVPSMIDAIKKRQWSQPIAFILCIFLLETPFFYYAAGGFSEVPYGRWEVFISAILLVFVASHLDEMKRAPKWEFDVSYVLVAVAFAFTVWKAKEISLSADYYDPQPLSTTTVLFGVSVNMYTAQIIFQAIWYTLCYLFLRFSASGKNFRKELLYVVSIEAIIAGNIGSQGQGYQDYWNNVFGGHDAFTEETNIVQTLDKEDTSFYRLFNSSVSTDSNFDPNLAMAEGYNGMGTFCSTLNYDSEKFFEWSRLDFGTNSYMLSNTEKMMNLDAFLSVKYYLLKAADTNIPLGYVDASQAADCTESLKAVLDASKDYKLYENTNYIDRFFAFDDFMLSSTMLSSYDDIAPSNQINYLKKAIIDADYYNANKDLFADFNSKDYISGVTMGDSSYTRLGSAQVGPYTHFRIAKWDYDTLSADNSGVLRTIVSSMSDADFSDTYRSEIEAHLSDASYLVDGTIAIGDLAVDSSHTTKSGGSLYFRKISENNFFYCAGDTITSAGMNAAASKAYYSKVVLENKTDTEVRPLLAPDASTRDGAFITIGSGNYNSGSFSQASYTVDYYLYGYDTAAKTYHLLTHDDNNYRKESSWKISRGFYVNEPVYRVVGLIKTSDFSFGISSFSYEYGDEYAKDIAALKAEPAVVDYTKTNANTIVAKTDYSKKKIVVVNEPYSTGWTLKAQQKDANGNDVNSSVTLFKADGGMLGFIAEPGETVYTLSYYTPGLKSGMALTYFALFAQGFMFIAYYGMTKASKDYRRLRKRCSLKDL
jgi:uncharacterized membrane protein YfhO